MRGSRLAVAALCTGAVFAAACFNFDNSKQEFCRNNGLGPNCDAGTAAGGGVGGGGEGGGTGGGVGGGEGGGTGGGGGGSSVSDSGFREAEAAYALCVSITTQVCDYASSCGQVAASARGECRASVRDCDEVFRDVQTGRRSWFPAFVPGCMEELQELKGGCNRDIGEAISNNCAAAIRFNGAPGVSCTSSLDCELSGYECAGDGGCTDRCSAGGGLGQPCQPVAAITNHQSCDYGLFCNPMTRHCAKAGNVGADCTNDLSAIENPQCDPAFAYCDEFLGKCVPLISDGGSCSARTQCINTQACVSSKCGSPAASCNNDNGCRLDRFCSTGSTCVLRHDAGVACTRTAECQLGLVCANGVCGPRLAEDAGCDTGDICQANLACDTVDHVCRRIAAAYEGEHCSNTRRCQGNTTCSDVPTLPSSVCKRFDAGVPCPPFGPCGASTTCSAQSFCTVTQQGSSCSKDDQCPTGFICNASLCEPARDAGATCSLTPSSQCQPGLICRREGGSAAQRCLPTLDEGEACGSSADGGCTTDSQCSNSGTCQRVGSPGQACPSGGTCGLGYCDGGTCQGFGDGTPCSNGLTCASGFCDPGTATCESACAP